MIFIHRERSLKLRELPKGASTVLSVGCAGGWYFDWFAENYGQVGKHIGLPEPTDLPSNVRWVPLSVDDMPQVGTGTVDVRFSGQNIGHLEPAVLLGFLRESNRVFP
jgi:hypothetical protein